MQLTMWASVIGYIFSSSLSWAQSSAPGISANKNLSIEWYTPTQEAPTRKDRLKIVVSGKTLPGTEIRLGATDITVFDENNHIETLKASDIYPEQKTQADKRGVFQMDLDLPLRTVVLPVQATLGGLSKSYQLGFKVEKNRIKMMNAKAKNSPYTRRLWGLWAGLGYNYLEYSQSTNIPSNLRFQSFDAPSIFFKFWRAFGPEYSLQATFNRAPGLTSSSGAVVVQQGSYAWTYFAADLSYLRSNWKFRYKKYFTEMGILGGLQYHEVPFLARSSTTDPNAESVNIDNLVMVALGGEWLIHYDRYWLLETSLRYQYPVYSSPQFDIEPNVAFDGSVGLIYKYRPDFRFGVFWYGQYQDYNFKNHRDVYLAAQGQPSMVSGSQYLFFTNIELRFGWEFD
jgi:hypothetical protein